MRNIDLYIAEKLKLDKDIKIFSPDLDSWYLLFHKLYSHVEKKDILYIENILKIKNIDMDRNKIEVLPEGYYKSYKFDYIIVNDNIVLAEDEYSLEKSLILPKEEALDVLKRIKKDDYFDFKKYFNEDKGTEIRKDNADHKITDEEIDEIINELNSKK